MKFCTRLIVFRKKNFKDGRQLIHWACSFGSLPLVNLCIEKGSTVDVEDDSGWTPLIIAASAGHKPCVELLLSLDADVNAENSTKSTALHYAASKNHVEVRTYQKSIFPALESRGPAFQHLRSILTVKCDPITEYERNL
jgi:ankyrin repeat protein